MNDIARLPERPEAPSADVRALLRPRSVGTHKYKAGHVAIFAGSPGKVGAALLAAEGALRGGAGAATLATWPDVASRWGPLQTTGRPSLKSHMVTGTCLRSSRMIVPLLRLIIPRAVASYQFHRVSSSTTPWLRTRLSQVVLPRKSVSEPWFCAANCSFICRRVSASSALSSTCIISNWLARSPFLAWTCSAALNADAFIAASFS